MHQFYRACDVICIPSRSEPFGRTVVEAFAVGAPVVASAVGGIRETVRSGENGLAVEFGDVPALVEALSRLIQDRSLRETLSRTGVRDARERYSANAYQ